MHGMSINKIYLPEVEELKEFLKENGSSRFYIRYVRNRDVFIGSSDSTDFIDTFCKKYNKDGMAEFTEID